MVEEEAQTAHVRDKAAATRGWSDGDRTRMQVFWSKGITAFQGMKAPWSKSNPDLQKEVVGGSLQSRESHRVNCSKSFPSLASQTTPSKYLPAFFQLTPLQLLSQTWQWLLCSAALSDYSHVVSCSCVLASLSRIMHSLVVSAYATVGINTKLMQLLRVLSSYLYSLKLPKSFQFLW